GAPELSALRAVARRARERLLGGGDVARAELEAAEVEDVEGDLVTPAHFSEHVRGGHAHVIEGERRRGRAVESELRLLAPAHDAHPALDDEGREPLAADFGEDREHVREAAVRDPHLLAVEYVVRAVGAGRGTRARGERVGAGTRLG